MKKLIRGIVEFHEKVRPGVRETFARLALGQSPDALLIACSDSRVAPNLFASTEPGDLFVIRTPGNLIAPCVADGISVSDDSEAAAIEFSVLCLNVRDIIVCGHSECGAMRILADGRSDLAAPHLHSWLRHAQEAQKQVLAGERMVADLTPQNNMSQFNVLRRQAAAPRVVLRHRRGRGAGLRRSREAVHRHRRRRGDPHHRPPERQVASRSG